MKLEVFMSGAADFSIYKTDLKTKLAVERNMEIKGEAVSRILNKDNSILLSNSRKIVIQETGLYMATTLFPMKSFGV